MERKNNLEDLLSEESKFTTYSIQAKNEFQNSLADTILKLLSKRIFNEDFNKVEIFEKVQQRIKTKKQHHYIFRIASIAAILAIAITLVFNYSDNFNKISNFSDLAFNDSVRYIQFTSGQIKYQFEDRRGSFRISNDGKWLEVDNQRLALEDNENNLIVPYGHQAKIIFEDGSEVMVNSGSYIEFPSVFERSRRSVKLIGEAFFSVAKNKNCPFYILTPHISIRVLGTKFNLSAYPDDRYTNTILTEGKVALSKNEKKWFGTEEQTYLSPGEMGIFEKNEKTWAIKKVDPKMYTSWIKGYIEVEKESLPELLKKVGRFYDVRFEIKNESLNTQKYSGTLSFEDDLDSLLPVICKVFNVEIEKKNKLIIVK